MEDTHPEVPTVVYAHPEVPTVVYAHHERCGNPCSQRPEASFSSQNGEKVRVKVSNSRSVRRSRFNVSYARKAGPGPMGGRVVNSVEQTERNRSTVNLMCGVDRSPRIAA